MNINTFTENQYSWLLFKIKHNLDRSEFSYNINLFFLLRIQPNKIKSYYTIRLLHTLKKICKTLINKIYCFLSGEEFDSIPHPKGLAHLGPRDPLAKTLRQEIPVDRAAPGIGSTLYNIMSRAFYCS